MYIPYRRSNVSRSQMFSGTPPQLTGPFEVSLKAERSVLGLAVLWGVLIPLRSASRELSVWLSPFIITPEWSQQLLLLHICFSISWICEVTYVAPTSHAALDSPDSSVLLSAMSVSLSIFGSFNFRLNLTIFLINDVVWWYFYHKARQQAEFISPK